MANNSQSRQPAASRPPLPHVGTRRRRSDYEMPCDYDMSRYNMRGNDWDRHHLNAVYEMPNHAVMPSYSARQDDMGHFVDLQHGSSYYSREHYLSGRHVNAPYDHHLPSVQSFFAAVGVGGGRPQIPLLPDDCSTLVVEGLPAECTRREVSHIFRPFLGFKDLRLVRRGSRQLGSEPLTLCFAEFLSPAHAAAAMDALQGKRAFGLETRSIKYPTLLHNLIMPSVKVPVEACFCE